MPCALVSSLDRQTVQAALARMTLHDHFQVMVTAEDELETISQRLLTASVKLGRAPNMCVFFDSSPPGITAAHNVTFKAVAVQVRWSDLQMMAAVAVYACAASSCSRREYKSMILLTAL